MARGKGYFWSGLAQGLQGLYGAQQNERLQKQSQDFRAIEGDKDRAQRDSQFDKMFPKPGADTLNPDLDSAIRLSADADAHLSRLNKQYADLSIVDPGAAAALKPQVVAAAAQSERAKAAARALQDKTLNRQGAPVPRAPAADNRTEKQKFLDELMK